MINKNNLTVLFISSLMITIFLFYIDEGSYNFKWMTQVGSWIVFFIYAIIIFLGQVIVLRYLFRKKEPSLTKLTLGMIAGSSLGLIILFAIFFRSWHA